MDYHCEVCNMPAVEWKLNQLIHKDKNLINKLPANWIHPLNIKFKSYRFQFQ